MRTTVRLDDSLLRQAKRLAANTGRTLTAVIEDALRLAIAEHARPRPRSRIRLPTVGGNGPQPGIDLDHTAALIDAMERADDAG